MSLEARPPFATTSHDSSPSGNWMFRTAGRVTLEGKSGTIRVLGSFYTGSTLMEVGLVEFVCCCTCTQLTRLAHAG